MGNPMAHKSSTNKEEKKFSQSSHGESNGPQKLYKQGGEEIFSIFTWGIQWPTKALQTRRRRNFLNLHMGNPMAHKSSTNKEEKKFSQSSNGEIATISTPSSKFGSFLMAALSKLSQHPPLKEIIVDSVEPTTETSTMN